METDGVSPAALNQEEEGDTPANMRKKTFILGYDGGSFEVGDVTMKGSLLALPRSAYIWKPRTFEEITFESLAMVPLLKPPVGMS